ncbi:MAG: hypothetical protein M3003_08810 [Candidatus Dormibacteraeota bacterium]|nr:hypothetical protein [Candidatus Dormibacteraeota bacterium]
MRSSTIQALIADLENENIEPLTDTPGVGQARFAAVGLATTVSSTSWAGS